MEYGDQHLDDLSDLLLPFYKLVGYDLYPNDFNCNLLQLSQIKQFEWRNNFKLFQVWSKNTSLGPFIKGKKKHNKVYHLFG